MSVLLHLVSGFAGCLDGQLASLSCSFSSRELGLGPRGVCGGFIIFRFLYVVACALVISSLSSFSREVSAPVGVRMCHVHIRGCAVKKVIAFFFRARV